MWGCSKIMGTFEGVYREIHRGYMGVYRVWRLRFPIIQDTILQVPMIRMTLLDNGVPCFGKLPRLPKDFLHWPQGS